MTFGKPSLDPVYADLFEQFKGSPNISYGTATVEEFRENTDKAAAAVPLPDVIQEEKIIKYNGYEVKIYVIRPLGTENDVLPAVVFYHGGGFVWGSIHTHGKVVRDITIKNHVVLIFVDYSMAPEIKYPIAHEECYATYNWVLENGKEINIDTSKLTVMGDSAGGNLASSVTLLAKERGTLYGIKAQFLIYPWVGASTRDFPSYHEFSNGDYPLDAVDIDYYDRMYFESGDKTKLSFAHMATVDDLRDLPPTVILTAEIDPLRDEAEEFARKLTKAGVPTACVRSIGAHHGYFSTPIETPIYKQTMSIIEGQLKEIFYNKK